MRKSIDDINAQVLRTIPLVPISQSDSPISPTASVGAARQCANSMNELMVRIGFPMGWLAASCNYDARTIWWPATFCFHRCS
jgi:hypothetical protein